MPMNCVTIFGMTLTVTCILGLQGPLVKIGQKDFNFHRKKRYVPLRLRSLRGVTARATSLTPTLKYRLVL